MILLGVGSSCVAPIDICACLAIQAQNGVYRPIQANGIGEPGRR